MPNSLATIAASVKTVYVNGEFTSPEAAVISPFDRGFIFGDGVYEVIPIYGRRLFRFEQHLARLERNLEEIGIAAPLARAQWHDVLTALINEAPSQDQSAYLQITRGVAPRDHGYPVAAQPTVFAYVQPLQPVDAEILRRGVAAVTATDTRWQRCDIKTTSLLANVTLRQRAAEAGATEAILVRDGIIAEGAASNIFVVSEGALRTPPQGPTILPGVTRDLVLELARGLAIPCDETAVTETELAQAEEIWMSSSTKELLPITRLDGAAVGGGAPGPMFSRVYAAYQEFKAAFRAA